MIHFEISNDRLSISRLTTVNNGLSLKSLAADLLNVCLDKSLELRCSDWEADQLTLEQVVIVFHRLKSVIHTSDLFYNPVPLISPHRLTIDGLCCQRCPSVHRALPPPPRPPL